jgi:hypothetical protein
MAWFAPPSTVLLDDVALWPTAPILSSLKPLRKRLARLPR